MLFMNPRNRHQPPQSEPVRRIEAGPWAIELLPGCAYATRYVATQSAIGFAFDSQRGLHAIGSDRVQPFEAIPNGLAFVPAECDVFSESPGAVNTCGSCAPTVWRCRGACVQQPY